MIGSEANLQFEIMSQNLFSFGVVISNQYENLRVSKLIVIVTSNGLKPELYYVLLLLTCAHRVLIPPDLQHFMISCV